MLEKKLKEFIRELVNEGKRIKEMSILWDSERIDALLQCNYIVIKELKKIIKESKQC